MTGGSISGNFTYSTGQSRASGAGVRVNSGTFDMSGGQVSGNKVMDGDLGGGGVYVAGGELKISGNASISGNTANYGGGGVMGGGTGLITMTGGAISNNVADNGGADGGWGYGGGVYMHGSGVFNMHGGTITGNHARMHSGGTYREPTGTFNHLGGTISGNTPAGQVGTSAPIDFGEFGLDLDEPSDEPSDDTHDDEPSDDTHDDEPSDDTQSGYQGQLLMSVQAVDGNDTGSRGFAWVIANIGDLLLFSLPLILTITFAIIKRKIYVKGAWRRGRKSRR
jgi:hypothetical protein